MAISSARGDWNGGAIVNLRTKRVYSGDTPSYSSDPPNRERFVTDAPPATGKNAAPPRRPPSERRNT